MASIRVAAVDHFVLRVRDLERTLEFYHGRLGLAVEFLEEYRAGTRPFVSVRVGGMLIDLVPDTTFDPPTGATHGGLLHFCVRLSTPLGDAIDEMKRAGVEVIEDQPMMRMGATGVGPSIYVRDPDGYVVELKGEGG